MSKTIDHKGNAQEDATSKPSYGASVFHIHIDKPWIWQHGKASVTNCPSVVRFSGKCESTKHEPKENPNIPGADRHLIASNDPRALMVLMAIQIAKRIDEPRIRIEFRPRKCLVLVQGSVSVLMQAAAL